MVEKSSDPDLATAFSDHLEQTRGHVSKVESLPEPKYRRRKNIHLQVISGSPPKPKT